MPLCQPWQDKVCEHSALDGQPGRDREKVEAGPPPPLALVADGCVRDPRCPKNISLLSSSPLILTLQVSQLGV